MMTFLFLIALLANLALCAWIFYKVTKIHLASFSLTQSVAAIERETGRLFGQVQAYLDLKTVLALEKPLPPLRGWAASPDFLLIIASHTLASKPRTIVECSSGCSTVVLARCCQMNHGGQVFSLEHEPEYAERTRALLEDHGLTQWATVVDAPLVAWPEFENHRWYSLEGLGLENRRIELLVVDGPPSDTAPLARYPAVPALMKCFSDDITIFVDDADRDEDSRMVDRWLSDHSDLRCQRLYAEKGCARIFRHM